MKLQNKEGVFVQIQNKILDQSLPMGALHERYRDSDGFLYIRVHTEDPF